MAPRPPRPARRAAGTAGEVWRAAGPAPWTDAGLPALLAAEATQLWRQVEQATWAALLHVNGGLWQVRADQATAALTAAATAWGAQLRHCDEVTTIAAADGGALVHTRSATVWAAQVMLAGTGPLPADPDAPVVTVRADASYAVPATMAAF